MNQLNRCPIWRATSTASVIDMTGDFKCRQWYGWHASYSTLASGNRLFIRTEYLYSIGDKAQSFEHEAFLPR